MRDKLGRFIKGHKVLLKWKKIWSKKFKGKPAWNKGKKGIHYSPATEFKKGRIKTSKAYSFPEGKNNPRWKGGKHKHSKGYVLVRYFRHPFAIAGGYIFEHRLVMEQILGRYLKPNEFVHHRNGIKDDNRPENLMLFIEGKNWHPCLCPKCGFEFLIK